MTAAPPPGEDPSGRQEEFLTWPDGTGAHLLVPDDLTELDAEVTAFRRERALAHRAARREAWSQWVPRAWRRYGATAPLLIVSMLLIGAFGAMLVLFGPRGRVGQIGASAPLASPTVAPGLVKGLLPDVALVTLNNSPVSTRELRRPSLVLVLPSACANCAAVVKHVLAASEPYTTVARYIVATDAADARKFSVNTGRPVEALVDHGGTLLAQLAAGIAAPTLAVVGDDGTIRSVVDDVDAQTPLTAPLDKVISASLSAQASS